MVDVANEEFSKMAKILQPYLGHGGSQAECVDKMMELMTNVKYHHLIVYNENTFKSYFTGRSSINRLARRVAGHLSTERMAKYIDGLDYQARSRIAKSLMQVGISTHPSKAGDAYARKLEKIINDAAQGKSSVKKKPLLQKQQRLVNKVSERVLSNEYVSYQNYELLVIDNKDFSHDGSLLIQHDDSRVFGENTDQRLAGIIWDKHGFLSAKVKHYPVIFGNEFNGDSQQKYYYGVIDEVNEGTCGIYLHYRIFGSLLREELYKRRTRIQIEPIEFYRRHWAMKHVNILKVIKQTQITKKK